MNHRIGIDSVRPEIPQAFARWVASLAWCCLVVLVVRETLGQPISAPATAQETAEATKQRKEDRKRFQSLELMPGASGGWIIKPGDRPRLVWRDVEEAQRLGAPSSLRVRWFHGDLQESPAPDRSGRWIAWVEGHAPNGFPYRRAFTFYAIPTDLKVDYQPDLTVDLPNFPGPKAPVVLQEHRAEVIRLANDLLVRTVMDNERGAILFAGIAESQPLGHAARFVDTADTLNDDRHLAVKLQVQGLQARVRTLKPPRPLTPPAIALHEDSLAAAGMRPDTKLRIDDICREWAEDSGEPFVTLVARRGVIVTHEAFGKDAHGTPVTRDFRCWTASITKSVTAILFSQFVDQGMIRLDDPLSHVFPDFPRNDRRVPTFRQCFNHTSGLSGMGDFGGMRNPHFENVILNALDVNEPNSRYEYSGIGFELAAKAMELIAGKSAVRLYDEYLFRPLKFGDVPMGNASSDGEFTALELGILGQWIANQGSYGELQFISPETFQQLLPQPLTVQDRGFVEDEGIGMHWIRLRRPGTDGNSKRPEDLLFSPRTVGHGSFSGCIFLIDPEQQLVITQVRKNGGPRHAEWSSRFYQTIADSIVAD